ncbi:MAG: hypothetical protein U5M51_12360 [Emticicia sp.]|nr:hypothetical protein [Emticicia sp.]
MARQKVRKKGVNWFRKCRKLRVQGPAKNIPDYINVDIKDLDLGKSVKVTCYCRNRRSYSNGSTE